MGDLPTWGLFVGALVAAAIALRQLRIQQRDSARLTTQLEREQPNKVSLNWFPGSQILVMATSVIRLDSQTVVVIENNSMRPIRAIQSWIDLASSGTRVEPTQVGLLDEPPGAAPFAFAIYDPVPGTSYRLLTPGAKVGFIIDYPSPASVPTRPAARGPRPAIQFTDDADIVWQIDADLRLTKVTVPRERRWADTLGSPGHRDG